MTSSLGAPDTPTADVVIVSMSHAVLVLVSGHRTMTNVALVEEVRESLIHAGTPSDEIDVLWS